MSDLKRLFASNQAWANEIKEKQPDFYRIAVSIEVRDVKHLHNVVTSLNADTDVAEITRHRDLVELV